ncbi:hypothetical protein HRI_001061000 [Hibiscus trionum]|uniref:Uncharacterized protein n=1 Tax=Hibiscus trionum TaxID=183268 RepID=A0A9W7HBC2_HIBTR|nr:hypothetical protein HRI_001061000 [Hibiscus trionum]
MALRLFSNPRLSPPQNTKKLSFSGFSFLFNAELEAETPSANPLREIRMDHVQHPTVDALFTFDALLLKLECTFGALMHHFWCMV